MTQYPLYGSINYRGKKKPEINKDLAEQGKEETMANITRELEYAEKIKVLEAENEALQRNNKRLNKQYHIWNIKACNIDGELYNTKQKLDEAKEIIRLFLSERFNESEWQNIQNKAEAFLKGRV